MATMPLLSSILATKGGSSLKLNEFIKIWNNKFPYDRWWRKKYNIPFGSPEHLAASHIHMAIDLIEDQMFKKIEKDKEVEELNKKSEPTLCELAGIGNEKSIVTKLSGRKLDKEFDDLDISQFNENINNG